MGKKNTESSRFALSPRIVPNTHASCALRALRAIRAMPMRYARIHTCSMYNLYNCIIGALTRKSTVRTQLLSPISTAVYCRVPRLPHAQYFAASILVVCAAVAFHCRIQGTADLASAALPAQDPHSNRPPLVAAADLFPAQAHRPPCLLYKNVTSLAMVMTLSFRIIVGGLVSVEKHPNVSMAELDTA